MSITARNQEAIHIGQIVQDAAIFDFKNWRKKTVADISPKQPLLTDVSELFFVYSFRPKNRRHPEGRGALSG